MREFKLGRLKDRFVVTWWGDDGKRRRHRLDADTRGDAEREAIDVIRRETRQPAGLTVADIWRDFRADYDGRPIAKTMGYEEKAILPVFGHLRPDQITKKHCLDYTAKRRAADIMDGSIWTELGHLRIALRWAEKTGLISRAPHITRPPQPKPKDRWLNQDEARRLVDAADGHIRLAILLMLSTACRVGAALDLTWDRVSLNQRQIDLQLPESSTRKGRARVPINGQLMAALVEALPAALTDYVIEWAGKPVASIKTGFNRAVERAELEDVTPHVLRHTAAVWMAAGGVPMERISQYLGHSSTEVTERIYARFAPDHLRDAADVLDFMSLRQVR